MTRNLFSALKIILVAFVSYVSVISALDIYNNFAYDKAVLKPSPYGYVPLLENPKDYSSGVSDIKGGDFVYVEDWTSAINGRIVFAKVKSKLNTGYINQDLLVETNINVMPVLAVLLLGFIFVFLLRKLYNLYHHKNIVLSEN